MVEVSHDSSIYMTSWQDVHVREETLNQTSYTEVNWSITDQSSYSRFGINDVNNLDEEALWHESVSNQELTIQGIPIKYHDGDYGYLIPQFDWEEITFSDRRDNNSSASSSSSFYWQEYEITDIKLKKKDSGYSKNQTNVRKRFVSRFQDSKWSEQMGQQQQEQHQQQNISNNNNQRSYYCLKSLHSHVKASDCDNITQTIARREMLVETQILLNLCSKSSSSHPNIIQIYGIKVMMESPEDSFIITDCIHELLSDRIERWRRNERLAFVNNRLEMALEIASALAFLHDRHMIYFLRPEKIGFDTRYDRLKLCQMGEICKSNSAFRTKTKLSYNDTMKFHRYNQIITNSLNGEANNNSSDNDKILIYAPPELLLHQTNLLTTAVDVYSFGILLWRMITLKEPYNPITNDVTKLINSVCKNHERPNMQDVDIIIPTKNTTDGHSIQNLLQNCWDPYKRPNMHVVIEQIGQFLLLQDYNYDTEKTIDEMEATSVTTEDSSLSGKQKTDDQKSRSISKVSRNNSDDPTKLSVLRQQQQQQQETTEDDQAQTSPTKKKIRVVMRRAKSSELKNGITMQQLQVADEHEKLKEKLARRSSVGKGVKAEENQGQFERVSPSRRKSSKRSDVDPSNNVLTSPGSKTDPKLLSPEIEKKNKEKSASKKEAKVVENESRNDQGKSRSHSPSKEKSRKSSLSPPRPKTRSRSPSHSPKTDRKIVTSDTVGKEKSRKSKDDSWKEGTRTRSKSRSRPSSSSPTRSIPIEITSPRHVNDMENDPKTITVNSKVAKTSTTKNNNEADSKKERRRSISRGRTKSKSSEKRSESTSPFNIKDRIHGKLNAITHNDEKSTTKGSGNDNTFESDRDIVYAAMKALVNQEICNLIRELEEARVTEPTNESRTKSKKSSRHDMDNNSRAASKSCSNSSSSSLEDLQDSPNQTRRYTTKMSSPKVVDKHRGIRDSSSSPNERASKRSISVESPRRKTQHRINIQQIVAESPHRLRRSKTSETPLLDLPAESPRKSPRRGTLSSQQMIDLQHFVSPGMTHKDGAPGASILVTRRVHRTNSYNAEIRLDSDQVDGETLKRSQFRSEGQIETFKFNNGIGWEKQDNRGIDDNRSPSPNHYSLNRISSKSATLRVIRPNSPVARRGSMDSNMQYSQAITVSQTSVLQSSLSGDLGNVRPDAEQVTNSPRRIRRASVGEMKARMYTSPQRNVSKKSNETEAIRKLQKSLEMATPLTPTGSPKKTSPVKKKTEVKVPAKLFFTSGYKATSDGIDSESEVDEDKAIWEHIVRDRRKKFSTLVLSEIDQRFSNVDEKRAVRHNARRVSNGF